MPEETNNMLVPNKPKVKVELVGTDSNAFALIGRWKQHALRQGWTGEEVKVVTNACFNAGSYESMLGILVDHSDTDSL